MVFNAGVYWIVFNLVLGLFNMLPFGPLDGLKVKDWSNGAFFTVIGVFVLLVFTMYTGVWSASNVLSCCRTGLKPRPMNVQGVTRH